MLETRIMFLIVLLLVIWFIFSAAGREKVANFVQAVKGS